MSIAPATEIVVSLMSQNADAQGTRQLHDDPRTYIYKTTNINIPHEVNVTVAENSESVVNLALPYYDALEHNSVLPLGDDDLNSADGGIGTIVNGLLTESDIAKVTGADSSAASEEASQGGTSSGGGFLGPISWGLSFGLILGNGPNS